MAFNTPPEDWTATELFDFLQENYIINEDDIFDDWIHCRGQMVDMVNDFSS